MKNIQKYKILIATIVMQVAIGRVSQSYAQNSLQDIEEHWAKESISQFISKGYIGGYEDSTFRPNNNITRAEFVKLINKVYGFTQIADIDFKDVNSSNWFYNDLRIAMYEGYINGYTDKTFRPNNNITREEIATIITNIMSNKDPKIDKIGIFNDLNEISNWAKDSVEGAIEGGFIGGYEDNTIRPKSGATRAESVAILSRVDNLSFKQSGTALIENNNYILKKHEPRDGAYLGSYVIQDTVVNASMDEFEKLTGKKHVSYFFYLGYKKGDLQRYDKWMSEVVGRGGIPHVALEPNQGLNEVYEDTYLVDLAKMFGKYKSPIYLRYASEMNGNWVAYHGDPELYKEKWRIVHDVMEKYAPNVIMVWTPYEKPVGNILDYYPGDKYVDWVGVNLYNVVYRDNDINKPVSDDPLKMLSFVYHEFSNRKPIQISEYAATHDTISDDKDYTDHAIEKINRLYGNLWEKYPRIKSIFYFNVNNIDNAPEGRRINNYSLTENQKVLNAYKNIIKSDYFLSDIKQNPEGKQNREIFTLKDDTIQVKGQKYINVENISKILGGEVYIEDDTVTYTINQKNFIFKEIYEYNNLTYVKINEVAKKWAIK